MGRFLRLLARMALIAYVGRRFTPNFHRLLNTITTNAPGQLRDRFFGHWVKIIGWMLFGAEHQQEPENTATGQLGNWRATAWEIHPVTWIEVMARPRC
jgi:hypothetical protein